MSDPPIPKDENGYYHPSSEEEIIKIVKYAYDNDVQLRVRGSGHSVGQVIYTDECTLDYVDVLASAPKGNNINIKLDRYTKIIGSTGSFVTVEAGIHLGHDPLDPLSTLETSLLYQLHHTYGLAVDDLGGITHQTVSGFISTGSSGGSIAFDILENVHALRIVDGTGETFEVSRDDANQDKFKAALVSLGVLGVLSRVTLNCSKKFNIKGFQVSNLAHECHVDIFDDNPTKPERKGLTSFLVDTHYTRILWWPQTSPVMDLEHGRLQVWQAEQIPDTPDFERKPFKLFENAEIMMLYSYLMTLMGNIEDMDAVRQIMAEKEAQFKCLLTDELKGEHGITEPQARALAKILQKVNEFIMNVITGVTDQIPIEIRLTVLPVFTAGVVKLLNELDKHVEFQDHGWLGLPMDNTADDILVPTMFTEVWVPLSFATKTTNALRDYFKGLVTLPRTGNNAWELYASKVSDAWMSMSYSDGTDEWKDGAFRIDPYWFSHNSTSPRDLYHPIWVLLHDKGIPFRLHWGKIFPSIRDTQYNWRQIIVQSQYPRLQEFLALRKVKDPKGIFLSSYWRYWLSLD